MMVRTRDRRFLFVRPTVVATCLVPLLFAGAARGAEPVRLVPYPQKLRHFYSTDATNIPPALRTQPVPLPVGGVTATVQTSDGALWLGTTQGLMRVVSAGPERDRRQYFAGQRYLPDDHVRQLVADGSESGSGSGSGVWARTATGVARIELRPMTLAQKAEHFEKRIRARHDRYGMVADSRLEVAGDVASNRMEDNDNDGLWTAIYATAECFRYAVTRSPEALANARKSLEALLFLEEVAGKRGFPARSYVKKGDRLPTSGEWHWTRDGQYYWKADTSSDEIVGHFFAFSIATDLLPDADLKGRMAATTTRIMEHILDHDYSLVDLDGKRTTWGYWSPEALQTEKEEMALNSLELLSFLKTAAHITGNARYEKEYRKMAVEKKYLDWQTRMKEVRTEMNYSDEELAMLPYYCVFRYEKDPDYLKAYRKGLDAWWENMRREANPLWTFIYLTANPEGAVDLEAAAWTLYRSPMDTIKWSVRNSHRADIEWGGEKDRHGRREAITLLAPDERPVMRWNSNPFVVDGGDGGAGEDDGAAFLLPYWMGRFHGFLQGE